MKTFFDKKLEILMLGNPELASSILSGKVTKLSIPLEEEKINGKWVTRKQEVFDLINRKYYIIEVDKPDIERLRNV